MRYKTESLKTYASTFHYTTFWQNWFVSTVSDSVNSTCSISPVIPKRRAKPRACTAGPECAGKAPSTQQCSVKLKSAENESWPGKVQNMSLQPYKLQDKLCTCSIYPTKGANRKQAKYRQKQSDLTHHSLTGESRSMAHSETFQSESTPTLKRAPVK